MRAQALPPPRSPDENPENPACEKPKRGPPRRASQGGPAFSGSALLGTRGPDPSSLTQMGHRPFRLSHEVCRSPSQSNI